MQALPQARYLPLPRINILRIVANGRTASSFCNSNQTHLPSIRKRHHDRIEERVRLGIFSPLTLMHTS